MQTTFDPKTIAVRYIEAVGAKDYGTVLEFLTPDVTFRGPVAKLDSAEALIGALRRMAPVWDGNTVRHAFAADDRACVVYDFVTNTAAGAVPCVETLTFRDGKIASIELFFDLQQFAPAAAALAARNTAVTA